MTTAFQIFTQPSQQALDTAANVLSGATLTFTLTGTSTPTNAYSDSALTIPVANPLAANSAGVWAPVFLNPTITYRIVLKSAAGVVLQTWDPANENVFNQGLIGFVLYPRTLVEIAASVTPINYFYPEGYVDRYATNTTPNTTDMTAAITAAVNVAHAHGNGGTVVFLPGMAYRATSVITYPATSVRIHMVGNGAYLNIDHIGNGIDWIVTNENYSGHTITDLTITGPNALAYNASNVSVGAGVNMNRNATTNAVTAYNNRLRNVVVQGFKYGLDIQAAIGLNATDCYLLWNQYGIQIDGGTTNANCFMGCHVRYNRNRGISSTGRTGGSLSNATNNKFYGCLIESNVPDTGASGGTAPNSTAIYLNGSYDFVFRDCYSENHAASIYLTGSSKGNRFENHRTAPGDGRIDQIVLDGAGIYNNVFDIKCLSASLTEVSVISNNADQLFNKFSGEGVNFVSGSVVATLDFSDIRPSLNFSNVLGYGLLRMPSHGYASNVSEGTSPGQINGIATATAALNARGLGEIAIGNGITGNTTITSVNGLSKNSLLVLRSTQAAFNVTLSGSAFGLTGGLNAILSAGGQTITLWIGGDGNPREVGRNYITSAGLYTVTNGSADRSLNVTADTLAQGLAVLGTLIGDLQARGILS